LRPRATAAALWAGALLASAASALAAPPVFGRGDAEEVGRLREASRPHLRALARKHGLDDNDRLQETAAQVDPLGFAHLRVRQVYRGVPVLGGEAIVHFRPDGSLFAITDNLLSGLELNPEPFRSGGEAAELAVLEYGCRDCLTARPQSDLWVLRHGGADHLAWRVRLRREDESPDTALPVYFIDAHTGVKVWDYDDLQTASGRSLYAGVVSFETHRSGTTHFLEDLVRRLGTFDNRNTDGSTFRLSSESDEWPAGAAVDAHYAASRFLDYLLSIHGRKGLDGASGPGYYTAADGVTKLISLKVRYGTGYNNAFWNGSHLTFGDGDGRSFGPLVSLDLVAHEMMHAVVESTAGLIFAGESGALNDSWADVFGALTERSVRGEGPGTWAIGEDAVTPGVPDDALRYLDEPTRADDPDHYRNRYTGPADNGGVHTNSGIASKAFFLVAKGGTHRLGGSVQGVGVAKAGRIWFDALANYMASRTDFLGAREATIQAATALYGPTAREPKAVCQAWFVTGVGGPCK
jgi:bacillolysin